MRFDEPDVRDAYRRGVQDLYESVAGASKPALRARLKPGSRSWRHGITATRLPLCDSYAQCGLASDDRASWNWSQDLRPIPARTRSCS
jgi:hypothetical protein